MAMYCGMWNLQYTVNFAVGAAGKRKVSQLDSLDRRWRGRGLQLLIIQLGLRAQAVAQKGTGGGLRQAAKDEDRDGKKKTKQDSSAPRQSRIPVPGADLWKPAAGIGLGHSLGRLAAGQGLDVLALQQEV